MENISICSMCVSEFPNVRSKISKEITLEEFFRKVKGESFKRYIEQYRLLRATPGREAEAQRMKDSLPCIVPSGVCRGGHAVKNLVSLSETLCIDLDYTNGRTKEVFARVKALPWARGAIVSPSGEGVKVFVGIHPEEAKLDYPRLYAEVGEAVSRCVEHPYDEKCRILTQPCFYSWDPEAYFRPDAELFPRFLSDCSLQGSRGVASSVTEDTSWEGDSFRKSEETFTPFVVEETSVKSGLYTDGRVGEQEAEASPFRKAATPAKTANQPNQAENQSNEQNRTVNQSGERNQAVNQSNEQNQAVNQLNEQNRTVDQLNELNQTVNQSNEQNQTVNQQVQLNRTVNQSEQQNRTANQSGELNRTINEPNELNQTVNQSNEQNRTVNQPNQLNQAVNQQVQLNRTVNQLNERNQAVNQSNEQNQTENEPNEQNRTVNQQVQLSRTVNQLEQQNRTVNQSGERNRAVNQPNEQNRTVNQPNQLNQAVNQQVQLNRTVNQSGELNQAENQSNEQNQTVNQSNQLNQTVNQPNEQNRTTNEPNELNQAVNQLNELNQTINQSAQLNKTVNQPNEQNRTTNEPNEQNQRVNQPNQLNQTVNQSNEQNRTVNQLNELNRAVNQPNQLNQTVNQSGEPNRTVNQPNEQNRTTNEPNKQNQTVNQPNELNRTVNQSNQPNQAVKQLKQPNQLKQAVNQSKPKEPTVSQKLPGMVPHFLDRFEHRNPFVRGQRNDIALKLGREAALHRLSLEELEELTKLFSRHYSGADFTARDIRERIQAGYQFFMNEKKTLPEDIRYQFGIKTPYNPFSAEEEGESTEEVLAFNNDLRAAAPYIPDEVYNTLPPFLQRCVKPATHPRERDILLLGTLNSCSALFPYVRFLYHKAICSPHFYLAVVAPAGAGKGVLSYTSTLLDATQDYYDAKRVKMKKEQEEAQLRWEQEVQTARREKRPVDVSLRAEQSPVPYFKIPATTSKSRLIESLASGGEVGCCMVSTEIVTLSSAIGQDYGRFEDILLKASHHEEVSSSYKADSEPLVARNPHLAVCLAGTQEQFYGFFHSLEVGLFSRFGIYTRQQELKWESCAPKEGEEDLRGYFRTLGKELFTMHEALLQSPTWVTFTPAQWEAHTLRYTELVGRSATDGREATGGVIFRNGLLAMRLAAILTVFRKWDDYRYAREYACSDEDFHSAMTLAGILLEHGLLLSTSLPESQHKPVKMRNPHRLEMILKILPSRFTFMEFIQAASEVGITRPSAARILAQAVSLEVLKKGKKEYRKVKTPVKKGL